MLEVRLRHGGKLSVSWYGKKMQLGDTKDSLEQQAQTRNCAVPERNDQASRLSMILTQPATPQLKILSDHLTNMFLRDILVSFDIAYQHKGREENLYPGGLAT